MGKSLRSHTHTTVQLFAPRTAPKRRPAGWRNIVSHLKQVVTYQSCGTESSALNRRSFESSHNAAEAEKRGVWKRWDKAAGEFAEWLAGHRRDRRECAATILLNVCTSLKSVRHASRLPKFRRRRTDLERHISLCHVRAL